MKSNRKAQEEMIGLVMVIVVVIVIFLILLGIFIRRPAPEATSSVEVSQFLDAMSEYTTSCSLDGGFSFKKIDDLAEECESGSLCSSGEQACSVLEETLTEIIEASWNFSPDSPEKSYRFTASFPIAPDIILSSDGFTENCSPKRGADKAFAGEITFVMEICL